VVSLPQLLYYLYKTASKEFEFLHKSYATAVAVATMTFPDGGYFDVVLYKKKIHFKKYEVIQVSARGQG
jgi:hypothetical protein